MDNLNYKVVQAMKYMKSKEFRRLPAICKDSFVAAELMRFFSYGRHYESKRRKVSSALRYKKNLRKLTGG